MGVPDSLISINTTPMSLANYLYIIATEVGLYFYCLYIQAVHKTQGSELQNKELYLYTTVLMVIFIHTIDDQCVTKA